MRIFCSIAMILSIVPFMFSAFLTNRSPDIVRNDLHITESIHIRNSDDFVVTGNLYLHNPDYLQLDGRLVVLGDVAGDWRSVTGTNARRLSPTWQWVESCLLGGWLWPSVIRGM